MSRSRRALFSGGVASIRAGRWLPGLATPCARARALAPRYEVLASRLPRFSFGRFSDGFRGILRVKPGRLGEERSRKGLNMVRLGHEGPTGEQSLGAGSRRFKSSHPDQSFPSLLLHLCCRPDARGRFGDGPEGPTFNPKANATNSSRVVRRDRFDLRRA